MASPASVQEDLTASGITHLVVLVAIFLIACLPLTAGTLGQAITPCGEVAETDSYRAEATDSDNSPPSIQVPDVPVVSKAITRIFTCNCSDADIGDHIRLTWLWGDNKLSVTEMESTGEPFVASTTHTYMGIGMFYLTVWIDDLTGFPDHNVSDSGLVGVCSCPPPAPYFESFVADNYSVEVNIPVTFTLIGSNYPYPTLLLNFDIDFGDGESVTITGATQGTPYTVQHVYDEPFPYYRVLASVSRTITGDVRTLEISVTAAPIYNISLSQGWNLISLPSISTAYTSNTLGLPFGSVVVKWSSINQSYDMAFIVGLSPPSTAFALLEGVGYWISVASSINLTFNGNTLTTVHSYDWSVPSGGGWVLAGFPTTNSSWMASEVREMCTIPGAVSIVVRFDTTAQIYQAYIPAFPMTDFALTPGDGYWIYLTESVTADYGPHE